MRGRRRDFIWGLLGAIMGFLASHVTAVLLMFWWVHCITLALAS